MARKKKEEAVQVEPTGQLFVEPLENVLHSSMLPASILQTIAMPHCFLTAALLHEVSFLRYRLHRRWQDHLRYIGRSPSIPAYILFHTQAHIQSEA